jgi:hypothetical protein
MNIRDASYYDMCEVHMTAACYWVGFRSTDSHKTPGFGSDGDEMTVLVGHSMPRGGMAAVFNTGL